MGSALHLEEDGREAEPFRERADHLDIAGVGDRSEDVRSVPRARVSAAPARRIIEQEMLLTSPARTRSRVDLGAGSQHRLTAQRTRKAQNSSLEKKGLRSPMLFDRSPAQLQRFKSENTFVNAERSARRHDRPALTQYVRGVCDRPFLKYFGQLYASIFRHVLIFVS
jgi:hypothetical protein